MAPACNICGGPVEILLPGDPGIVQCPACSLATLSVFPESSRREELYQEEYYRERTGDRFFAPFEVLVRFFRWLRARAVMSREGEPGGILDVGCGRGIMLEILARRGWRVTGTQLSRPAAEAARRRGVTVHEGELTRLSLPGQSFDVVTFFHVLEHVTRPQEYLRRSHDLLVDGGLLIVEVPNFDSPGFRVLGTRNFCFDYPNHLVFFTPGSLAGLLERSGFRVEGVSHFSLEYSPFSTLQNLLNLLPGPPNRFYRSLMTNEEGAGLRRDPRTWALAALAAALSPAAFFFSLLGLVLPVGNTIRLYCRKSGRPQSSVAGEVPA